MLIIDDRKKLSLNSPFFDKMREDLDVYIRHGIVEMEKKDIANGAITLKIEMSTEHNTIRDDNSPTGERETIVPIINYKISMSMQSKAERKGKVVGIGHELVQDNNGSMFILTNDEASGQLSMFDAYEQVYDGENKALHMQRHEEDDK